MTEHPPAWEAMDIPLVGAEEDHTESEEPIGQTLGRYVHSPYASVEQLFRHLGVGSSGDAASASSSSSQKQKHSEIAALYTNGFPLHSRDIVMDLGCGDGRACLVAASPSFRVRGIGIDIEAELIDKFQKKADSQNISDRLLCVAGDAMRPMDTVFAADAPKYNTVSELKGAAPEADSSSTAVLPFVDALGNEYVGKTHPLNLARFLTSADEVFPRPATSESENETISDVILKDLKLVFIYIVHHRLPLLFPVLRELKKRCPHVIFASGFPFNEITKPSEDGVIEGVLAPVDVLPTGAITYYIYKEVPDEVQMTSN